MNTFVFGFDVEGMDKKGTNSCKGALEIKKNGDWKFTNKKPQFWFDEFGWESDSQIIDVVEKAVEKDCPFQFAASVYGGARHTFLFSEEFASKVGVNFEHIGNCKSRKRRFPGENDRCPA